MSSEKRGTIGSFALLGMTVAAVFGIKNIINNNAAIGLAAAPSFFFATLLYFVPYTLVTAEFVGLNTLIRTPSLVCTPGLRLRWVVAGRS